MSAPDAEGHPACLPEVCPFANGYYDRRKDALAALLDGSGSFSRAALADTARQFSVCPFELGLDLSEWCDVVIGDYNYLFDLWCTSSAFSMPPGTGYSSLTRRTTCRTEPVPCTRRSLPKAA